MAPINTFIKPTILAYLRPIFLANIAAGIVALAVPATIKPKGKVANEGSEDIFDETIEPINTIIGAEAETKGPAKNNTVIFLGNPVNLRMNTATIINPERIDSSGKMVVSKLFN